MSSKKRYTTAQNASLWKTTFCYFSAVLQLRHWFLKDSYKGDKIHLSETKSRPIMPAVRRPENVQTYTHTHTHTNKQTHKQTAILQSYWGGGLEDAGATGRSDRDDLAGKATKSFRNQPKVTSCVFTRWRQFCAKTACVVDIRRVSE